MTFHSDPRRYRTPEQRQEDLQDALDGDPRLASSDVLLTAKLMIEAQIASRRALISGNELWPGQLESLSRQIEKRVERIRQIVTELRKRGVAVEWEE